MKLLKNKLIQPVFLENEMSEQMTMLRNCKVLLHKFENISVSISIRYPNLFWQQPRNYQRNTIRSSNNSSVETQPG